MGRPTENPRVGGSGDFCFCPMDVLSLWLSIIYTILGGNVNPNFWGKYHDIIRQE